MENDKSKKFKEITNEMIELFERKNSDYNNSIHDTYMKYGAVAYLVRMEDKINRVRSLVQNKEQKVDEKIHDTLVDLANYSILMLLELEGESNDNK